MEFNATFIVSALSFCVFTIIMNMIFYKPIQKIVNERQQFIDETFEEAKLNKKKSESIIKDKDKKIRQSKHDAKKIILDKAEEVKAKKTALTTEAQQKAAQTIDGAKAELQKSKVEAQESLSSNVVNLAQDISSRVLGENIQIVDVDKNLINNVMKGSE